MKQPIYRASVRLAASAIATGIALATAGCAVGPDYVAPKSDLAPFKALDAVRTRVTTAPAPALDTWWQGFDDAMLTTVIKRALAQNLDLAAAVARVEQARAEALGSRAALFPSLDVDAAATTERQSLESPQGQLGKAAPGYSRRQREYTVGAAASWEIDLFGGTRRGLNAALDDLQAASADHVAARITVAGDAADAYLQVRGHQARFAVAQDQIDTDAKLLKLVEARYRLGQADGREVAQAQALLRQARASLPALRIGLQVQLNRLDVLMGAQPGTYAQELSAPGAVPAIPAIAVGDSPTDLLRRRPDIIAAERRLAASNERIGQAIADYYPKLSLSGVLGFDSSSTRRLFRSSAFQPIGTGAVTWRLFDFGRVDAEIESAKGANSEALALYRRTVLVAAQDVEDALISLTETEVHVSEVQEEVDALERARDLADKAYKAGAITLTDVLDANRQLLVARDELNATRTDAARAAVRTFRAFGGGWTPSKTLTSEVN